MKQDIQQYLLQLTEMSAATLNSDQLAEIMHFVEVNECGIALQTLADIHREERLDMLPHVKSLVKELAVAMGLDPETVLDGSNRF